MINNRLINEYSFIKLFTNQLIKQIFTLFIQNFNFQSTFIVWMVTKKQPNQFSQIALYFIQNNVGLKKRKYPAAESLSHATSIFILTSPSWQYFCEGTSALYRTVHVQQSCPFLQHLQYGTSDRQSKCGVVFSLAWGLQGLRLKTGLRLFPVPRHGESLKHGCLSWLHCEQLPDRYEWGSLTCGLLHRTSSAVFRGPPGNLLVDPISHAEKK